jgi:hypothetical protein
MALEASATVRSSTKPKRWGQQGGAGQGCRQRRQQGEQPAAAQEHRASTPRGPTAASPSSRTFSGFRYTLTTGAPGCVAAPVAIIMLLKNCVMMASETPKGRPPM